MFVWCWVNMPFFERSLPFLAFLLCRNIQSHLPLQFGVFCPVQVSPIGCFECLMTDPEIIIIPAGAFFYSVLSNFASEISGFWWLFPYILNPRNLHICGYTQVKVGDAVRFSLWSNIKDARRSSFPNESMIYLLLSGDAQVPLWIYLYKNYIDFMLSLCVL